MKLFLLILSFGLSQTSNGIDTEQKQVNDNCLPKTEHHDLNNSNLRVTYEETINIPESIINKMPENIKSEVRALSSTPIIYILNYNGNTSNYLLKNKVVKTSMKSEGNSSSFELAEYSTFKNYGNNELIVKTGVMKKKYLINKKIDTYDWKITGEIKMFGNIKTKKAIALKGDKKITAYYTDQVGISEGPSIYNGLPGLIIYLEAPDRCYLASKIEYPEKLIIEKFNEGVNISEDEYQKVVEENKNKTVIEKTIEKNEI